MSDAVAALAPGFRFHPTDGELVGYYLRRKVSGKPFLFDPISLIDIYKSEPWDLPGLSRLKSRDLEWYFFSALDKKYGVGSRTNRATDRGYWKTTGKDRPIQRNMQTIGMKKTLVYHIGRAPHGERTNWVMHEYRLEDQELGKDGVSQAGKDAFVLCRVFQKSGAGPKNGEQYGAPFVEEEWDDDLLVPQKESGKDTFFYPGEPSNVQPIEPPIDHVLNPDMGVIFDDAMPITSFSGPDGCNNSEDLSGQLEGADAQKLVHVMDKNSLPDRHDNQGPPIGVNGNTILPELPDGQNVVHTTEAINLEVDRTYSWANDESYVEMKDIDNPMGDFLAREIVGDQLTSFGVSTHNQQCIEDCSFLEMNDILKPAEADASGLEYLDDILRYLDSTEDDLSFAALPSELSEKVDPSFNQSNPALEADGGSLWSDQFWLEGSKIPDVDSASSSKQKLEARSGSSDGNANNASVTVASDFRKEGEQNKFHNSWFSSLLESIPSPPAFAAEYPMEGSAKSIQQISANNSGATHVDTEAFFISDLMVAGRRKHWSVEDTADVGFLLSYGMRSGDVTISEHLANKCVGVESLAEVPSKATSAVLRSAFYFCSIWVVILAVSFKIGSYVYAR